MGQDGRNFLLQPEFREGALVSLASSGRLKAKRTPGLLLGFAKDEHPPQQRRVPLCQAGKVIGKVLRLDLHGLDRLYDTRLNNRIGNRLQGFADHSRRNHVPPDIALHVEQQRRRDRRDSVEIQGEYGLADTGDNLRRQIIASIREPS